MIETLLKDRTTGRNILWANAEFGAKEIQPEEIYSIKPRHEKIRAQQKQRTRERAEIFTPPDVCEFQNNLLAAPFKDDREKFIHAKFLEITCGEAPYITTRYNAVTGEYIAFDDRVGLLDQKLKVIAETKPTLDLTLDALKSVYGYEFQGDNLFIARRNVFDTVAEFLAGKTAAKEYKETLKEVAEIISWNFWQMDGITNAIPYANKNPQGTLGGFGEPVNLHEKIFCEIMDWEKEEPQPIQFRTLLGGGRR